MRTQWCKRGTIVRVLAIILSVGMDLSAASESKDLWRILDEADVTTLDGLADQIKAEAIKKCKGGDISSQEFALRLTTAAASGNYNACYTLKTHFTNLKKGKNTCRGVAKEAHNANDASVVEARIAAVCRLIKQRGLHLQLLTSIGEQIDLPVADIVRGLALGNGEFWPNRSGMVLPAGLRYRGGQIRGTIQQKEERFVVPYHGNLTLPMPNNQGFKLRLPVTFTLLVDQHGEGGGQLRQMDFNIVGMTLGTAAEDERLRLLSALTLPDVPITVGILFRQSPSPTVVSEMYQRDNVGLGVLRSDSPALWDGSEPALRAARLRYVCGVADRGLHIAAENRLKSWQDLDGVVLHLVSNNLGNDEVAALQDLLLANGIQPAEIRRREGEPSAALREVFGDSAANDAQALAFFDELPSDAWQSFIASAEMPKPHLLPPPPDLTAVKRRFRRLRLTERKEKAIDGYGDHPIIAAHTMLVAYDFNAAEAGESARAYHKQRNKQISKLQEWCANKGAKTFDLFDDHISVEAIGGEEPPDGGLAQWPTHLN